MFSTVKRRNHSSIIWLCLNARHRCIRARIRHHGTSGWRATATYAIVICWHHVIGMHAQHLLPFGLLAQQVGRFFLCVCVCGLDVIQKRIVRLVLFFIWCQSCVICSSPNNTLAACMFSNNLFDSKFMQMLFRSIFATSRWHSNWWTQRCQILYARDSLW